MKIKQLNGNNIECDPTQEAIEALGIDTFNYKLIIKKDKGYLLPLYSFSGSAYSENEREYKIENIELTLFNRLFRKQKIMKMITDLYCNNSLLSWKLNRIIARQNWKMPIETDFSSKIDPIAFINDLIDKEKLK